MKHLKYILILTINFLCSPNVEAVELNIPKDRIWYVTDFGAKGDAKTLNTFAIQKTIDHCTEAGGGTVRIPPGVFLSGTLILKDGVQLYLDINAKIIGSKNQLDYKNIKGLNVNNEPRFGEFGSFLIYAENAKHISIAGSGEINGNGDAFWEEEMLSAWVRKPKKWRPAGLIGFVNCQFINIRGVSFINSPCYTIWPLGCNDVNIDGITIRNPLDGPNTDGLDIDCCRRVSISNCNIAGGDDAIAIKSDGGKLGENRSCENIVVSNCTLSSPPACAIRIGYEGDAPIRNCVFSNITMYSSNHGIDVISILPDRAYPFTIFEGTKVENLQFDNIVMQDVNQPIYMWLNNEKKNVKSSLYMRGIRISNLMAKNAGDSYIRGSFENNIEDIFLSNIYISLITEVTKETVFYENVWSSKNPYALYVNNVTNLHIDNFFVDFSSAKGAWKHAINCRDSRKIVLSKISTKSEKFVDLISQIGVQNSSLQVIDYIPEDNVKSLFSDENSRILVDKEYQSNR